LTLPKRHVKKVTLTLPEDEIEFLDACAGAVGQDRSGFLALVLDGFYDEITAFAKGYATRILEQAAITEQRKNRKKEKT
jgi:hypothetical protein